MPWRERLFLGWVAPRGIVAASMASLFAISLDKTGRYEDPKFLETFTFSVIIGTVLFQGFTAGPLASLLKLKRPAPTGWAVVGAHPLARRIARYLRECDAGAVWILDTNARAVREARAQGLEAHVEDARDADRLAERFELQGIGNLIALTDNQDLNMLLCQQWVKPLGREHVFRWGPAPNGEGRDTIGRSIWTSLPKPSLLSAELERGEASVIQVKDPGTEGSNLTTLLAMRDGSTVRLDPGKAKVSKSGDALILRRRADYLARSVRPELVSRIAAPDLSSLLAQLVDLVVSRNPRLPREEILHELLEREKSFPTALGHGIAVPHAYSSQLESRLCAIAQIPDGVDFRAPDGEPVRLAFLLLSPSGDPEGHLATMGEIARLVSDRTTRERLIGAEDLADVLVMVSRTRPSAPAKPLPPATDTPLF